tara:strand:- start:52 stop:399 length:348 start_codon:yes stop_codon:yes gene_type:complete
MSIKFGIETDCEKCKPQLNCWCRPGPNWELTPSGWSYKDKSIEDFDNVFNYIDWIGETGINYEMQYWQFEEIQEYIKEILLENHRLEQLLVISQGFDPNFKSIITGEPLWPSEEE